MSIPDSMATECGQLINDLLTNSTMLSHDLLKQVEFKA